jgi:hypothetical protein
VTNEEFGVNMISNPNRAPKDDLTTVLEDRSQRTNADTAHSTLPAAGFFLALLTMLLLADSLVRQPGAFEYWVINAIQRVSVTSAGAVFDIGASLTGLHLALAAWLILLIATGFARRWGLAIATLSVPLAAAAAYMFDRMLPMRSVPDPALVERTVQHASLPTLASGQVVVAVLVYGLLFLVARSVRSRLVRIALQGTCAMMILLAGVVQLSLGWAWPTAVLMAYAIGGVFLVPLLWIAQRVDTACKGIPLVHAAEAPVARSQPSAQALTSTVVFNGPTVSKIYRPGFLPRAIYWLAFQAEFPYMRNHAALRAAVQRRNLIGMLTEYWYGENLVARAIGIDQVGGRYAITSEYIDGTPPRDRRAARRFLADLYERFDAAGLPTWQIDPRQPRATDNVIETEDGKLHVIDLESGLVSPLASRRAWRRAFQRGQVPLYDDIFFDVTRSYIESQETAMRETKGDDWVRGLRAALDATEAETQAWHDSEPRIWSRLLGRRRQLPEADDRGHWAVQWFEDAIAQWRVDGRITVAQARQLRQTVRSPEFAAVMPHFAVHLGTGILLRFPLGSIARASYSAFHLLRSTWKFVRRQVDRDAWRVVASIHSPLVILLAAIPGFGAFAYLASKPVRSEHLLLRIGVDAVMQKLPRRIYERSGMRWVVTEMPGVVQSLATRREGDRRPTSAFGWAQEHQSGSAPDQHPASNGLLAVYGSRIIA